MDPTPHEASAAPTTDVPERHLSATETSRLDTDGWLIVPDAIAPRLLDDVTRELGRSLSLRNEIRRANRVEGNYEGTVHHLLGDHPVYVDMLAQYEAFDAMLRSFFSGNYILNSYGGVVNQKGSHAYVHQVHRDIRFAASAKRFMLNTLVMLDDFTLDNGATHLLSRSHLMEDRPAEDQFRAKSSRATGRRGSILFFDSRIWHSAGYNNIEQLRRALTLTFTNPFFKQQLDYPRLMGHSRAGTYSPYLRQVIGFNARVPATLEEYYVPVERRLYQRGQDDDA